MLTLYDRTVEYIHDNSQAQVDPLHNSSHDLRVDMVAVRQLSPTIHTPNASVIPKKRESRAPDRKSRPTARTSDALGNFRDRHRPDNTAHVSLVCPVNQCVACELVLPWRSYSVTCSFRLPRGLSSAVESDLLFASKPEDGHNRRPGDIAAIFQLAL